MKAEQSLAIAERRAQVLAYFAEHPKASYRDTAKALGLSLSMIKRDHDAAIAETVGRAADAYRAVMIARNNAIVDAFLPLALIRGSVSHAQAILAADKRTADLLGLDAPSKIDIEQRIRVMAAELGLDADEAVAFADHHVRGLKVGR